MVLRRRQNRGCRKQQILRFHILYGLHLSLSHIFLLTWMNFVHVNGGGFSDPANNMDSHHPYEDVNKICSESAVPKRSPDQDDVFELTRENHTVILLAYITATKKVGPGRYGSGAATMAVRDINMMAKKNWPPNDLSSPLPRGYQLDLDYFETHAQEICSIRHTAQVAVSGKYAAIIGPQETCQTEAAIAASYNLPMISYFCEDRVVTEGSSRKDIYQTFIRTRPPPGDLAMCVVSLLKKFNWTTVALTHAQGSDWAFTVETLRHVFKENNIDVEEVFGYEPPYLHNQSFNYFIKFVRDTFQRTRIYVMAGEPYESSGLLHALQLQNLLDDYFVILVDKRAYDQTEEFFTPDTTVGLSPKAFHSLFRVSHLGASNKNLSIHIFKENTKYLKKPPFNFFQPDETIKKKLVEQRYTSYLYDAIKLYAKAAGKIIRSGNGSYTNGTLVANLLLNQSYITLLNYSSRIDAHGDGVGKYIVTMGLARTPTDSIGFIQVGHFAENNSSTKYELHIAYPIPWSRGAPPKGHPQCGFDGKQCPPSDTALYATYIAPTALIIVILTIIIGAIFIYRNRRFEKELERLLWKISYTEFDIPETNEEKLKVMNIWDDRFHLDVTRRGSTEDLHHPTQSNCGGAGHSSGTLAAAALAAAASAAADGVANGTETSPLLEKRGSNLERRSHETEETFPTHPLHLHRYNGGSLGAIIESKPFIGTPKTPHDVVSIVNTPATSPHSQSRWQHPGPHSSSLKSNSLELGQSLLHSPEGSQHTTAACSSLYPTATTHISGDTRHLRTSLTPPPRSPCTQDNPDMIHCIYKKQSVVLKRVHKFHVHLNRTMKKDLKVLRELSHKNLTKFYGACVDPGHIFAVWEYCPRRSLHEILYNEKVNLDPMFISSLVFDILRGLTFLHESGDLRFHGLLTSSNCVVDSRWMCKLTDFGLHELSSGELWDHLSEEQYFSKLFWSGPEVLRHMVLQPQDDDKTVLPLSRHWFNFREEISPQMQVDRSQHQHSSQYVGRLDALSWQRHDIFGFGVILYELHAFKKPYADTNHSAREIIRRMVILNDVFKVPYRPKLSEVSRAEKYITDCIQLCWHEDPQQRLTVKTLPSHLKPMAANHKLNIVDNMIDLMESYAKNLERLVNDRTEQLIEEKKRTEELLYQMLPIPVAEQLKRGKQVEAEAFDCVTIYFSDICGFTELSASSTPFQVVQLLNELYTSFDSVIASYDVYKVETIGDAYMVVSGLPNRNERHAVEIASMSVRLLQEVMSGFTIHYQQGNRLKLRIGLHSGPCVAGVVGFRMPRYCLFGDTVNTASRMESHGEPLKIHCSSEFKKQVDRHGGFVFKERGLIEIKGKGPTVTYWLLGRAADMIASGEIDPTTVLEGLKEGSSPLTIPDNESDPSSSPLMRTPFKKRSDESSRRMNSNVINSSDIGRQIAKFVVGGGPKRKASNKSMKSQSRQASCISLTETPNSMMSFPSPFPLADMRLDFSIQPLSSQHHNHYQPTTTKRDSRRTGHWLV